MKHLFVTQDYAPDLGGMAREQRRHPDAGVRDRVQSRSRYGAKKGGA